jgi:hypothetical protein
VVSGQKNECMARHGGAARHHSAPTASINLNVIAFNGRGHDPVVT